MKNVYHVHKVLGFLGSSENQFTPSGLIDQLKLDFGEDAVFTTCGDQLLTPEDCIDFMIEKNKILIRDGKILLNLSAEFC